MAPVRNVLIKKFRVYLHLRKPIRYGSLGYAVWALCVCCFMIHISLLADFLVEAVLSTKFLPPEVVESISLQGRVVRLVSQGLFRYCVIRQ